MKLKGISGKFDVTEARGLLENYWFSPPGSVVPPIIEVGAFNFFLRARIGNLRVPYESEPNQRGVFVDGTDSFKMKYGIHFRSLDNAIIVMQTLRANLFPKNAEMITERLRCFPNSVLDFSEGKLVRGSEVHRDQVEEDGFITLHAIMCTSPPGTTFYLIHPNHPGLDISLLQAIHENELRQSRGNSLLAIRAGIKYVDKKMQALGVETYRLPIRRLFIMPNLYHRTTGALPEDPMPAIKEMSANRLLLLYMARARLG